MRTVLKTSYLMVAGLLVFLLALPAFAAEEYVLGPGDTIRVSVYEQADLTTEARINEGGKIVFPLIGDALVGGLTIAQAENAIADRLIRGGFIKKPQVTISVLQYRSQQVSILGKVAKPGKYPIEGEKTVLDLLAEAGGLRDDAADVIVVIKHVNGKTERHEVNIRAFYAGDLAQNLPLSGEDIVVVPQMDVFYIYGEVRRPGSNRLEPNMMVMQALSVAGGLTERGTERGIRVKRQDKSGKIRELTVELTDILQPDDVVYVKESIF